MLNEKQELFVQHYILTRNASEAAKAAGYSERSAYNQGYRLLQDEAVQQRIYDAEQEMTTDVDVISELENLSRVRGNKTNDEDILNIKKIVTDIQSAMKIIGKTEMKKLMKTCEWD